MKKWKTGQQNEFIGQWSPVQTFASVSVWVLGACPGLSRLVTPARAHPTWAKDRSLRARWYCSIQSYPIWDAKRGSLDGISWACSPLESFRHKCHSLVPFASGTGLKGSSVLPPVGTQWEESGSSAEWSEGANPLPSPSGKPHRTPS